MTPMESNAGPPENAFERFERTVQILKDALWEYRYLQQDQPLEPRKTGLSESPDVHSARMKPIVGKIALAAEKVQRAAEVLQAEL
jgi:hypothetical protein